MAGTQSLRIALSGRRLLGGSAAAVAAGVLLAACGGTATVAKATPSPTAKASRAAFSGAAGTVASVSGADFTVDQTKGGAMTAGSQGAITLEVQGTSGQTSVTVSAATKILQEASAALDDVTPGKCAVAIGAKAKTAIVTAESVSLSVPGPSGCSAGFGGLAGGFGGAPGAGGSFGSAG